MPLSAGARAGPLWLGVPELCRLAAAAALWLSVPELCRLAVAALWLGVAEICRLAVADTCLLAVAVRGAPLRVELRHTDTVAVAH